MRVHRLRTVLSVGIAALALSSCVLTENDEYVVQPAPPNGFHLTISNPMSVQLKGASDAVAAGVNIDHVLRDRDIDTTCPEVGTRERGDRCAFRILKSVDIEGWIAAVGNIYWRDAVADDEFGDFRDDAMAPLRTNGTRCLHVTIRNVGDWPIEWRDSNWTYRESSDSHC
jgi:hypothetical protein